MADDLARYEVLLGVCGGIAAYKVCTVVSDLVQRGAGIQVSMTRSARRFVGPQTFQALTGRRVFTSMWRTPGYSGQQHIQLSETADLVVLAPATANILAKAACGIADDLVSTMILSADCPVMFAPAMNTRMWAHPAVSHNVEILRSRGVMIIEPETGWLACRTEGAGRLPEPDALTAAIATQLRSAPPRAENGP